MKFLAIFVFTLFAVLSCSESFAAGSTTNILALNTASTNVTTSAFVQLSASTPIVAAKLLVANETTSNIYVCIGAASSEVGLFAIGPNATLLVPISPLIQAGTRISLKAVDATASSGYITVSLVQ